MNIRDERSAVRRYRGLSEAKESSIDVAGKKVLVSVVSWIYKKILSR
jgi:hypothetical protein